MATGVSAVIAHYGDPAVTAALVADLQRQVCRDEIEIIVSDDCSPQPYEARGSERVLRSETNSGYGAAINAGDRAAACKWLLILNSDLRIANDFVGKLISAAEAEPRAVFGVSQAAADGSHPPVLRSFPTPRLLLLQESAIAAHLGWKAPRPTAHEGWLAGSLLLIETAVFRDAGGFDERFFMYSEEVDLQRRLRRRGVPSVLIAGLEVVHEGGRSTGCLHVPEEMTRSRLRYLAKHFGQPARTGYAAALGAGIVADAAVESVRSRERRQTFPRGTAALRLRTLAAAIKPRVPRP